MTTRNPAAPPHNTGRRRGLFIAPLIIALTLAAAGSLAGPTASAEAAAWLAGQEHFGFSYWSGETKESCKSRTIWLKEGYYSHGAFIVALNPRRPADMYKGSDTILGPGNYGWSVCRWWSTNRRQYFVESTLRRGRFEHVRRNELSGNYAHGKGMYEWGARLGLTGELGLTRPSH